VSADLSAERTKAASYTSHVGSSDAGVLAGYRAAEVANKTPLAGWWTAHAGAWFAGIAVVWSAMMMTLASLRLNRWEE